ncbi:MAG: ABC transporter permease subunit [Bacteroidota bacterium]|nr:ABC transporter permease subunit [Bacteroidota bacterium]
MIKYIFKRLIIAIPTLFVISLVTFGLSLITPGDPVLNKVKGKANPDGVMEQSGGQDYAKVSRDLGLDRPAFYFTLTNQAYPDTFHRIINKIERLRYQELIKAYGNWDAIQGFDNALYDFEVATVKPLDNAISSDRRNKALNDMSTLFTNIRTRVWAKDIERDLVKMDSLVRKTSDLAQLTTHSFRLAEGVSVDSLDSLTLREDLSLSITIHQDSLWDEVEDSARIAEAMSALQMEVNAIASHCNIDTVSLDSSAVVLDSTTFIELSLQYDTSFLVLSHLDSSFSGLELAFNRLKTEPTTNLLYKPSLKWYGKHSQYHTWLFGDAPWFQEKHVVLAREKYSNGDAFVVDLPDREKSYFRIEMWERPGDAYDQIFNPTSIELLNNGYFEYQNGDTINPKKINPAMRSGYEWKITYYPDYIGDQPHWGILRGDFGTSYIDDQKVARKIRVALPWTALLNILAVVLAYFLAIPLGVYMAKYQGKVFDRATTIILFILYSLPVFWVGTLVIVFFTSPNYGAWTDLFPVGGPVDLRISINPENYTVWQKFGSTLYHFIAPLFTVTIGSLAYLAIQMRGGVVNVVRMDFIRTARAKGLPEGKVLWKHTFRNSLIPIITLFAGLFPLMISGSVIIEQIFGIPGMGSIAFQAILTRDYPIVLTVLMISSTLTIIGILVADVIYALVDPRISFTKKS